MSITIQLKGMRFYAYHGVLPQEKEKGQDFLVDAAMVLMEGAAAVDDLASTVDYAEVYAAVREMVVSRRFELVETLADHIAGSLLEKFPCRRVTVAVKKPRVPLEGPLEWAGAEVTREGTEPTVSGEGPDWMEVYLALGSNLGDRQANLWQALGRLASHPLLKVLRVSSFYETRPVGDVQQGNFLNAAARASTRLEPKELLAFMLEIEAGMGRERTERWGPRVIDLDLLLYGQERIELPGLSVPHPLMYERDFVMAPLAEIASEMVLPNGKTCREMLKNLQKFGTNLLSKIPGHVTI